MSWISQYAPQGAAPPPEPEEPDPDEQEPRSWISRYAAPEEPSAPETRMPTSPEPEYRSYTPSQELVQPPGASDTLGQALQAEGERRLERAQEPLDLAGKAEGAGRALAAGALRTGRSIGRGLEAASEIHQRLPPPFGAPLASEEEVRQALTQDQMRAMEAPAKALKGAAAVSEAAEEVVKPDVLREDFRKTLAERPLETIAAHSLYNLPGLVATIGASAIGGPVGGAGTAWLQEAGNEYEESGDVTAAGLTGTANMILEYLPAGRALSKVSGGAKKEAAGWLRNVLGQALSEWTTESLQELNQRLVQLGTYAGEEGLTWGDLQSAFSPENLQEYGFSGLIGAVLGGGVGAVTTAAQPKEVRDDGLRQQEEGRGRREGQEVLPANQDALRDQERRVQARPEPQGEEAVAPETPGAPAPGEVSEGIAELAAASQAIGQSPGATRRVADVMEEGAEGPVRRLSALDEAGEPVGSMTFTVEDEGFRVQDVETGARGTGGMRAMMRKAREVAGGPYLGSMAETDEGSAALARLQETDPDLFPEPQTFEFDAGEGLPSEAPETQEMDLPEVPDQEVPRDFKSFAVSRGIEWDSFSPRDPRYKETLREFRERQERRKFSEARPRQGLAQEGALGREVRPPARPVVTFESKESEDRWRKARRGVGRRKLADRVKESLGTIGKAFTREFIDIPSGSEFVEAREALRRVGQSLGPAADKVSQRLSEATGNLSPEEYDLFLRRAVLDDLVSTQESSPESRLPFGLTPEILPVEASKVRQASTPSVDRAIEETRNLWGEIREEAASAFEEIGMNPEFLYRRGDAYFHHQVLEYAELKRRGTGRKLKTPKGRGFQRQREGSEKDISANYRESQGQVLTQLMVDTVTAQQLARLDRKYSEPVKKRIRAEAKEKGVPWRELIPEGYSLWQPDRGNVFFMAQSVTDRIARRVIEEGSAEITGQDLSKLMAVGGRKREMVLPDEIVAALERQGQRVDRSITQSLSEGFQSVVRKWKQWQLFSPRRAFKYLARNYIGDSSKVFSGNPTTFASGTWNRSWSDLLDFLYRKNRPSPELESWISRSGFESGLYQQEIEASEAEILTRLESVTGFQEALRQLARSPQQVPQRYFYWIRKHAKFFESHLRYATYLDYLRQMSENPEGRPKNFGASKPEEIMAMEDPRDRAYWLSNQLIGAYDQISVAGQWLRRGLMPFWSFQELNVRSHWQMLKNALQDDRVSEQFAKKAGITVAKSPLYALRAGKWLGMVYAFEALLHTYNHLFWEEEEEELSDYVRKTPHIILGRDDDGRIRYFNRLGVFAEFREWFGIDEFGEGVVEYLNGRLTAQEVAKNIATGWIDRAWNMVGPLGVKGLAEALTGYQTFPSVTKPRKIIDYGDHVARMFALENEFRAASGRPIRVESYAGTIPDAFLYKVDPGEAAYYDTLALKRQFEKHQGTYSFGSGYSSRTRALRFYKQAIRYGQKDVAKRFLLDYYLLGGTPQGIEQSLRSMNPLYGLNDEEEEAFFEYLQPDEQEALGRAMDYYESAILRSEDPEIDPESIFVEARHLREENLAGGRR